MNILQTLLKDKQKSDTPYLRAGQVIRVYEKIKEGGDKERIQIFEGLVIAVKHGKGLDGTFTVRKIGAGGVGVERVFPLHMPAIEKIEILRQEHVRRAKLDYIRKQVDKKTKKRKAKIQNLIFGVGEEKEEEVEKELEDTQDVLEVQEVIEQENNDDGVKNEQSVEGGKEEISWNNKKWTLLTKGKKNSKIIKTAAVVPSYARHFV